jgi:hypothetical protein
MVQRALISLMLLAVVVELSPATPVSSGTRLTPANIKTQPLDFVIHAEKIGVLTRFLVSVQRPTPPNPPAMAGYLLIVDGKTKLASCAVAPAQQPKNVVYEFLVHSKHLQKSRFLLQEVDAKKIGVPNLETYWFYLEDFALAQISSSTGTPAMTKP